MSRMSYKELQDFDVIVKAAVERLGSDMLYHQYNSIFDGTGEIAWGGEMITLATSFFEKKPEHNLNKVIRLLENYLNPFKRPWRTHWEEAENLIRELKSVRSDYEASGRKDVLRDELIVEKLKDIFIKCNSNHEEGSLMSRLVYIMNQIMRPLLAKAKIIERSSEAEAKAGAGAGAEAEAEDSPFASSSLGPGLS